MKYNIYQIRNIRETRYAFRSWEEAETYFMFMDYKKVYSGDISNVDNASSALEELFVKFNINHPDDFRGHSLSVSDVVTIETEEGWKWFYCDDIGWKDITKNVEHEYSLDGAK